jgi:hypothetical protein
VKRPKEPITGHYQLDLSTRAVVQLRAAEQRRALAAAALERARNELEVWMVIDECVQSGAVERKAENRFVTFVDRLRNRRGRTFSGRIGPPSAPLGMTQVDRVSATAERS